MQLKSIGKRIAYVRTVVGLSQEEFARKMDKTKSVISHIESDRRTPSFDVIINMAELWNISTDWVILGRGQMYVLPDDHWLNNTTPEVQEFLKVFLDLPEEMRKKILDMIESYLSDQLLRLKK